MEGEEGGRGLGETETGVREGEGGVGEWVKVGKGVGEGGKEVEEGRMGE